MSQSATSTLHSLSQLVPPHGSDTLKEKLLKGDALTAAQQKAKNLPKIQISSREAGDLIMIGKGMVGTACDIERDTELFGE